jgi:hypothetical protein
MSIWKIAGGRLFSHSPFFALWSVPLAFQGLQIPGFRLSLPPAMRRVRSHFFTPPSPLPATPPPPPETDPELAPLVRYPEVGAAFEEMLVVLAMGLACQVDEDPEGDGICNLIEYALAGFDPTVADSTAPGTLAGGIVSFAKRPSAVANGDLIYGIEESGTLGAEPGPWTAVPPAVNNMTTISYALPGGRARVFVRLKISGD